MFLYINNDCYIFMLLYINNDSYAPHPQVAQARPMWRSSLTPLAVLVM